jgi:excisionase family DNA binding protein
MPSAQPALPDLMTVDEVAAVVRVNRKTVLNWRAQGLAPEGFRVGKAVLFHRDAVQAWLEKRREADAIAARSA